MNNFSIKNPKLFMLGGNANFSIINTNNNKEYKYKITKSKDGNIYFVKVKNSNKYEYAGYLKIINNNIAYFTGKNGLLTNKDEAIKGIMYAFKHGNCELPNPMKMTHHCLCAKCGRKLDDEESIIRGFGPICWEKIH